MALGLLPTSLEIRISNKIQEILFLKIDRLWKSHDSSKALNKKYTKKRPRIKLKIGKKKSKLIENGSIIFKKQSN
ncbi:hypothetical protein COV23_01215 [Candidatus Wolfebacteria bacterium CG10_big_fil_rev_8_21_14_0_10_31_9]|uniref:Uncharacterized protein n=1 Tax=Candidatus Wolfebacteria bacterium CG10_big_fil_rev_8_21_14_0_10_31_9 TaxID=1975070 RepID=A0A2H0RCC8_9BACT|nr:MAG: hypothetical protein COV23_01215 [Candidatus Wolfebacteria bacterium CG10_big_fil_rev_8_21_14_0_10_31_9]